MEAKEVFTAEAQSTFEVLCQPGIGYYIPPYQRDYSWSRPNIERLFEDTAHGIAMLKSSSDAITFLGSLITIHDTRYETVEPIVRGQLPPKVLLVIDGQQRLITFLLVNIEMHSELKRRACAFQEKLEPHDKWLYEQTVTLCSELEGTFLQEFPVGERYFRYYPRLIRAYDDSRAREEAKAKYGSPIASYMHAYIKSIKTEQQFNYALNRGDTDYERRKLLLDNCRVIRSKIKEVIGAQAPEMERVDVEDILNVKQFQETLLNMEFPLEVAEYLSQPEQDDWKRKYRELLTLVLFGRYLLRRVAVTMVSVKNESYAFDMFEALNTTGEPLTAFETFRPKVINAEGLGRYEASPSHASLAKVDRYLNRFQGAEKRQHATNTLLIPFALLHEGDKLSKRLSDQRRFLRDTYDEQQDIESKRLFVKRLADVADFLNEVWVSDGFPRKCRLIGQDLDLMRISLDVLRLANHSIVIAPLARLMSDASYERQDEELDCSQILVATKAVIAFFALWRASRLGTDNIDARYRELMLAGRPAVNLRAMMAGDNPDTIENGGALLSAALGDVLRTEGRILSKDDWIAKSSSIPIYKQSIPLARFLLLVATYDTLPDLANPGLIMLGRVGTLPALTWDKWNSVYQTVEHIAPLNQPVSGWNNNIYTNDETVDTLGNLVLLPRIENSSLSDRAWRTKRLMYQIMCCTTEGEIDGLMAEAETEGIVLSQSSQDILREAQFHPQLRALVQVDNWAPDVIRARSENLLSIVWDRLSPWLGLDR